MPFEELQIEIEKAIQKLLVMERQQDTKDVLHLDLEKEQLQEYNMFFGTFTDLETILRCEALDEADSALVELTKMYK